MRAWIVWSGGPCEAKYAGHDEPEAYHELEVFEASWFWFALEWLWDGVRAVLDRVPLPRWPKVKINGRWESPREYWGTLGDVMQCYGDFAWQPIVRRTLGPDDAPRVRVSCAFANTVNRYLTCDCGYAPRAPEKLPARWIVDETLPTTANSTGVTQISARLV